MNRKPPQKSIPRTRNGTPSKMKGRKMPPRAQIIRLARIASLLKKNSCPTAQNLLNEYREIELAEGKTSGQAGRIGKPSDERRTVSEAEAPAAVKTPPRTDSPRRVSKIYLRTPSEESPEYRRAAALCAIFPGPVPAVFYSEEKKAYLAPVGVNGSAFLTEELKERRLSQELDHLVEESTVIKYEELFAEYVRTGE